MVLRHLEDTLRYCSIVRFQFPETPAHLDMIMSSCWPFFQLIVLLVFTYFRPLLQATLPLTKTTTVTTRPNTVGGPAYSQSAYETKHEKDEQLQNLTPGEW